MVQVQQVALSQAYAQLMIEIVGIVGKRRAGNSGTVVQAFA